MKKSLSFLLTICIVISALSVGFVVSFAAGTKIENTNVSWSYDPDTKVLTFDGEGAIPDYPYNKTSSGDVSLEYPWKNLSYNTIVFGAKISGIGNYAFCYSKALKTVTIPENITTLGKGVFLNCKKLVTANVMSSAASVKSNFFAGCDKLKTVTLSSSIKTIESKAFYNCTELTELNLSAGLTSIGSEAFSMCISLETVTLPDTVKSIAGYSFFSCEALKNLSLGKKLQKIGNNAFDGCIALETLKIPSTVTEILSEAFSGCAKLKSVTLSDKLTTIGEKAFNLCPLLKEVTINATVETIGQKAFGYGKREVKIEDFTIMGFENTAAKTYATDNGFTFVSLGNYYFGDCGENVKWNFDPETGTLKITGSGAIADYSSSNPPAYKRFANQVKTITIDETVTSIGKYAFYNISPSGMLVPKTITAIGTKAIGKFSNGSLKEGFNIQGYAYTAAQEYATAMGMEFINLTPYEGSCGENARWKFDEELKTLTISGTGAMEDCDKTIVNQYRAQGFTVEYIVVEEGITAIGKYCFVFKNPVKGIRFPKTLESIGDEAFGYVIGSDSEEALTPDTELLVYGFDATPLKDYAEALGISYTSIDPIPLPELTIDESLNATIDKEKKIIIIKDVGITLEAFKEKIQPDLYDDVALSSPVIGTGTTLTLTLNSQTEVYSFVLLGDTNGDGVINSIDALDILNHSVETVLLTDLSKIAGDISGEGIINSNDALIVLEISVGKNTSEPAEDPVEEPTEDPSDNPTGDPTDELAERPEVPAE